MPSQLGATSLPESEQPDGFLASRLAILPFESCSFTPHVQGLVVVRVPTRGPWSRVGCSEGSMFDRNRSRGA
jgi:hypothetical protein